MLLLAAMVALSGLSVRQGITKQQNYKDENSERYRRQVAILSS
jgi:hypothetical protein